MECSFRHLHRRSPSRHTLSEILRSSLCRLASHSQRRTGSLPPPAPEASSLFTRPRPALPRAAQRAYSHVQMGKEWMASKCTARSELDQLQPLWPLLTFRSLMERSLMQQHWQGCWSRLGGDRSPSNAGAKGDALPRVLPRAPGSFKCVTHALGQCGGIVWCGVVWCGMVWYGMVRV